MVEVVARLAGDGDRRRGAGGRVGAGGGTVGPGAAGAVGRRFAHLGAIGREGGTRPRIRPAGARSASLRAVGREGGISPPGTRCVGGRFAGIGAGGGRVEQAGEPGAAAGLRADEGDELADALGGLPDGPVVAEAGDQGGHLDVRPLEGEVVTVECSGHDLPADVPMGHARVVVAQLVQRERQVPVRCLPYLVQPARRPIRVEHLPEHFHTDAVAQELARREQVCPSKHAVQLVTAIVIGQLTDRLTRHDVESAPLRHLLREPVADIRSVVVLGPWGAVSSHPLVPTALARLRPRLHPPLVDNCENLLAHPAALRLPLDLAAVDHPAAVGVRTVPVAAGHRARKLLLGRADDLERADAARGSRTAGAVGQQPDPGSVRRQPPVRRQRHEAVAVRAGDRARPEVAVRPSVVLRLLWKNAGKTLPGFGYELPAEFFNRFLKVRAVRGRPGDRRTLDQGGDRIQIVGVCRKAKTDSLERNAAAARCRIENGQISSGVLREPVFLRPGRRVAERAGVSVSVGAEANPRSIRGGNAPLGRHRIPVDPDDVQELLPVRVRRQQRRQDGRPRRHQRPARPPDVEAVRCRKRRHRRPLARALDAERRNRQPAFDQADVRHLAVSVGPVRADGRQSLA